MSIFGWLRRKCWPETPLAVWKVQIANGAILTADAEGTQRTVAIAELRRIVVATDDSGPWGADVVFLLYADQADPVGLFPLEAEGCPEFVAWMSHQAGYRDRELAKAMASTSVARFTVLEMGAHGSN